jgi:hypothetical protein
MTLVDKARAAASGDKHNYDVLVAPVEILRLKGWTYRAIHAWLRAEGQRVPDDYVTFAASMSKRLKHKRKTQ